MNCWAYHSLPNTALYDTSEGKRIKHQQLKHRTSPYAKSKEHTGGNTSPVQCRHGVTVGVWSAVGLCLYFRFKINVW